jgi:hypothetical protein
MGKVANVGQRLGIKVSEVTQSSFQFCLANIFRSAPHIYNQRLYTKLAELFL